MQPRRTWTGHESGGVPPQRHGGAGLTFQLNSAAFTRHREPGSIPFDSCLTEKKTHRDINLFHLLWCRFRRHLTALSPFIFLFFWRLRRHLVATSAPQTDQVFNKDISTPSGTFRYCIEQCKMLNITHFGKCNQTCSLIIQLKNAASSADIHLKLICFI